MKLVFDDPIVLVDSYVPLTARDVEDYSEDIQNTGNNLIDLGLDFDWYAGRLTIKPQVLEINLVKDIDLIKQIINDLSSFKYENN